MKSRKALRLQLVALGKQLEESIVILNGFDRNKQYAQFDRQHAAVTSIGRAIESFAKACTPALEKAEAVTRDVDIAPTQTTIPFGDPMPGESVPEEVRHVGFRPA